MTELTSNENFATKPRAEFYRDHKDENTRVIVAELIDLLNDERSLQDLAVITEILKTVHLLVKEGDKQREEIIHHPQLLINLSKIFHATHHVTRLCVSLFHDLSIDKNGIRLLLTTGIIPILLQSLESSSDDVINFLLTTIRNCLIGLPIESAEEIHVHNGCMILISALLQRHSDRQMNFLADCLLRLALFNNDAQTYLQTSKLFLQEIVSLLDETNYSKLSLTLFRMLPFLSSNTTTKSMLIQFNLIPIIERILKSKENNKIHRYCLLTLRNLSDQIIHMDSFDSLIVQLIEYLRWTDDVQMKMYITDILSNLSCENLSNKSLMIENESIPLLVEIIVQPDYKDEIIEAAICTLRHLTGKCHLADVARENDDLYHAIPCLIQFLHTKKQNWSLLRACIGLVRNLVLSPKNLRVLCEQRTVYRIGQLLLRMKTFQERYELFLTTIFVFSRQTDEELRAIVANEIINSGCLQLIASCAFKRTSDRITQLAQAILDDLRHTEYCKTIEEAEKSMKIEHFLHTF